jgi:D-3-phosphoglycerate dehydrogenase
VGDSRRAAILGTRYPDLSVEEGLFRPRGVRLIAGDGASPEAIVDQAAGADVVLSGSRPRFNADVIERLSCRGIVRYGVGVETIDLAAAARAGMWVAHVPDFGTDAVAVHAVALLLAAIRRLVAADAMVKEGGWDFSDLRPLSTPASMTVGIVGFGRIGRRVAELLAPFGFTLLANDAYIVVEEVASGVRAASLEELLSTSDAVMLHAPGRDQGRPLLGRAELELLKDGAVLVNTARGSLIDEAALLEGLRRGRPRLAALDVFSVEPPATRFEHVSDRIILTPHMAWYTEESELDLRRKATEEALRILDGKAPLHAVAGPEGVA